MGGAVRRHACGCSAGIPGRVATTHQPLRRLALFLFPPAWRATAQCGAAHFKRLCAHLHVRRCTTPIQRKGWQLCGMSVLQAAASSLQCIHLHEFALALVAAETLARRRPSSHAASPACTCALAAYGMRGLLPHKRPGQVGFLPCTRFRSADAGPATAV